MAARHSLPGMLIGGSVKAIKGNKRRKSRKREAARRREDREFARYDREVSRRGGRRKQEVEVEEERSSLSDFLFRHRRVARAVYVALALLLMRLPAIFFPTLVVFSLMVGAVLSALAVWWVWKVNGGFTRGELAEGSTWKDRVRRWLTPRTGSTVLLGAIVAWTFLPLKPGPAVLVWLIGTGTTCWVRAVHFRVRPVEAVEEDETLEQAWDKYLAAKGQPFEGSVIANVQDVFRPDKAETEANRIGWQGVVTLPRGSAGASQSVHREAALGKVATTFGVGSNSVLTFVNPDDEKKFLLRLIDPGKSAINQVHPYTGTDFDPATGQFTFGVRTDWRPGRIELYSPTQGARHGHISGATSGGKSAGAETLLRMVCQHNVVVPMIIDMKVSTFADWAGVGPGEQKAAVFVSDPLKAVQTLLNAKRLVKYRQAVLGAMRRYDENGRDIGVARCMPVSEEQPFISLVIDEFHVLFGDGMKIPHPEFGTQTTIGDLALDLVDFLVTQARTSMLGVVLITQGVTGPTGFGDRLSIRRQCQAGYMIAYRNDSTSGHCAFGDGTEVDPSKIPPAATHAGTCYMFSTVDGRDAMMRTTYIESGYLLNDAMRIPPLPQEEAAIMAKVDACLTEEGVRQWASGGDVPGFEAASYEAHLLGGADQASRKDQLVRIVETEMADLGQLRRADLVTKYVSSGQFSTTMLDEVLRTLVDTGRWTRVKAGTFQAAESLEGAE